MLVNWRLTRSSLTGTARAPANGVFAPLEIYNFPDIRRQDEKRVLGRSLESDIEIRDSREDWSANSLFAQLQPCLLSPRRSDPQVRRMWILSLIPLERTSSVVCLESADSWANKHSLTDEHLPSVLP